MHYLILSILLSFSLFAGQTIKTHIIEIEDNGDEQFLDVLVSYNGRIFYVDKSNVELIASLELAREIGTEVEIELDLGSADILDSVEQITKVTLLTSSKRKNRITKRYLEEDPVSPMNSYIPSDLKTYQKANQIFKTLRDAGRSKRRSECFNRAYVWSKYMHKEYGVKSMKLLIYYSRRYRQEIKGSRWWFHITPVVKVKNYMFTMDKEFHKSPKTIKNWQDFFTYRIPNKQYDCKRITHYSEFQKNYNNRNEWCFLQLTSMYYWEPNDLIRLENTGQEMKSFNNGILKRAIFQGFGRPNKVYRTLRD